MTAFTLLSFAVSKPVIAGSFYSITDLGVGGFQVQLNDAGQVFFHSQTDSGQTQTFFWSQNTGRLALGTLGGDWSWLDGINNAGQVFGRSTTASGNEHTFFWSESSGMQDWGSRVVSYGNTTLSKTDAGQVFGIFQTASGYYDSFSWSESSGLGNLLPNLVATTMNNAGQIGGMVSANGEWHAFFWSETTGMIDLANLLPDYVPWNPNNYPVSSDSKVIYISQTGKVLGSLQVSILIPCRPNMPEPIRYCYKQTFGDETFFWSESEGISELNTLEGQPIHADYMNNAGQVSGTMNLPEGIRQAFFWSESKGLVPLGTLGGYDSYPVFLTDDGYVLGHSRTADRDYHYFLWSDRIGMVDLGSANDNWTDIFTAPRNGQVIGWSVVPNTPDRDIHGFFWSETTGRVDLGTLGGNQTWADAFNGKGQVIGRSITAGGENHPFLWENGRISDLNSLIASDSGWFLSNAYSINQLGQIVGSGMIDGQQHVFLLTPIPGSSSVPEPTSALSFLAFGALGTGALLKRRYCLKSGRVL